MNLLMAMAMMLGGFFTPTTSPVIYVQESVNGVWDAQVRSAVAYVDRNTGATRMVMGHCHSGHRCIRIRFGDPGSNLIGSERSSTITVRRSWAGYRFNRNSRRNLVIHELGHAFGLGHTRSPVSVMYPNLYHGLYKMRPSTFSTTERKALRYA
jgi:hypothetical protein